MGCEEIRASLSEYIDGYLTENECKNVQNHLEKCENCLKEYKKIDAVSQMLQNLDEVRAPVDFIRTLEERLNSEAVPAWKRIIIGFNNQLDRLPLKAMTAAASIVLVVAVVLVSTNNTQLGKTPHLAYTTHDTTDGLEDSSTNPEPVVFDIKPASSGSTGNYVSFETPTEFLMSIVKNDQKLKKYKVIPHSRGNGVIIDTHKYLYEILMDPAEFPVIQAHIEFNNGRMPKSLREARAMYPIYVNRLPSPTAAP
jgi:anti-sigma factor (TIGR02949 family)